MNDRRRRGLGAVILAGILAADFLIFAVALPSPVLDAAPAATSGSAADDLARPAPGRTPAASLPTLDGADLFAPSASVGPEATVAASASPTTTSRPPVRTPKPSERAVSRPARTRASTRRPASSASVPAARYAVWGGRASWYDDGPGLYAAVPGWSGVRFTLTVRLATSSGPCDRAHHCVVVTVRDSCQCYVRTRNERAIDLSPEAFARLALLSAGIVPVVIVGKRAR